MRVALIALLTATLSDALKISALRGVRTIKMSAAASAETNAEYFAKLEEMQGVYSFAHPDGEFDVHLRSKARFWAPKFQCKSTWRLQSDGNLRVDFQKYGDYEFAQLDNGTFCGSAVGNKDNWRTMQKLRPFSVAERALMDSRWEFEFAGGSFEVEFRADAFNHFVCEKWPNQSL